MLALAPSVDRTDGSEGPALFPASTRLLALSFPSRFGARMNGAMDGVEWPRSNGDQYSKLTADMNQGGVEM